MYIFTLLIIFCIPVDNEIINIPVIYNENNIICQKYEYGVLVNITGKRNKWKCISTIDTEDMTTLFSICDYLLNCFSVSQEIKFEKMISTIS